MLEEAAQVKADRTPLRCTKCAAVLRRCSQGHARTFESRFGPITIRRTRGWCRNCKKWIYPADGLLGLEETAGYSPGVQEMAALAVSKLPVAEASAVIERLTGVKLPRATLDREARRQGLRAQAQRDQLDEQMQTPQADLQKVHNVQTERPLTPFTLVIQLDAWNIRERDDWGKSEAQRAAGQEPGRWHWVYGGTCFRLSQRGKTAAGRPVILSRGYVMTRGGIDALQAVHVDEGQRQPLQGAGLAAGQTGAGMIEEALGVSGRGAGGQGRAPRNGCVPCRSWPAGVQVRVHQPVAQHHGPDRAVLPGQPAQAGCGGRGRS
jgi:hypothetical protein